MATLASRGTLTAALVALAFALTLTSAAAREARREAPPAPTAAAKSLRPALEVQEIRLDNGLRIFVLEHAFTPTFAAVYRFGVGSAMDPKGKTGIAHLLEHMMFKGTRSVGTVDARREAPLMRRLSELWHELHQELDKADMPFEKLDQARIDELKAEIAEVSAAQDEHLLKNEYDEIVTRAGGVSLNAFTGPDDTTYMVQLPANRLGLWFELESDRLLDPVFREFYSERDVVREERRESTENSAGGLAWEAMEAMVFRAHPYGNPVIGWPRDIERLTREDAEAYFQTYYSPSNCIMVLVGDLRAAEVEKLARKHFGRWKRQDLPRRQVTAEPEQRGERRAAIEFDAQPSLDMSWRTVPEGHEDQYALDVLGRILGGLWSSRLDKTVVQAERIATSVHAGNGAMRHGGSFSAGGEPAPGHQVAELEAAIEREIARIQEHGVTAEELERARVQTEVGRVRRLKSNLGLAFRILGAVAVSGGLDYIEEYERRINAVTAEQVQAVAREYLKPERKNVVEVRRVEGAGPSEGGGEGDVAHSRGGTPGERGRRHSTGFRRAMHLVDRAAPIELTIPRVGEDVARVELACGPTVFIKEDHSAPSIAMSFRWLGGSNTTPISGLAPFEIADQLLTEGGTRSLAPGALEERTEQLGMRFSTWLGTTQGGASFWSLSRNFDESFALAREMLMEPRLDASRLEVIKGQHADRMRRRYDYPSWASWIVAQHVLDGDHPRLGYTASKREVMAVRPHDVRRLWERYTGRDNMYVTVVGDFVQAEMLELLERSFAGWRKAGDSKRVHVTREPVVRPGVYQVAKEVSSPAIIIGHHVKVDRSAPAEDHAALEILNDILGGSGFRSRLMERLRSDEGLTYGIYSSFSHEGRPEQPGSVRVSYETRKRAVAQSIDSVVEEFRKIIAERVTEEEVREQVEAWRNRFIFRFDDDFYSVNRLMRHELDDRPYERDQLVLAGIQQVTAEDVHRVAREYLAPENLTISVFGELTPEDREALSERFGLHALNKEEVFTGGWDEADVARGRPRARLGRAAGEALPTAP